MKKHIMNDLILGTNKRLEVLSKDLIMSGSLEFNSNLPKHDIESCYNSLLVDRVLSKFEKPDTANIVTLKAECFKSWYDYDSTHQSPSFFQEPIRLRKRVISIKQEVSSILKRFNFFLKEAPLELPKRETWVSKKGLTSYYEKINDSSVWTVTPDCVDLAVEVILQHSGLRQAAKKHLRRLSQKQYFKLFSRYGVGVLEYRIRTELLIVVQGSRASSVYKNTEKRRFINIEPMFNVILQKMIGYSFRQCLKENGCDLDLGQALHRKMIQSSFVCTVDIKNASDSTFLDVAKTLLPKNVLEQVLLTRSPLVLLPTDEGRHYVWPKKVSSMGNGFTFELLTLLLYAACQTFDRNSSVYGDDIIISKLYSADLIQVLSFFGYETNQKKTFIDHPVRESCGAFFIEGYGYISSYDIKWCNTINDVINTVNKLGRITRNLPVSNYVTSAFKSAYVDILRLCPALIRGPLSPYAQLPNWVECENEKIKTKKDDCKHLYRYVCDNFEAILRSWHVDLRKITVGVLYEPKENVYIKPTDNPNLILGLYYLYTGMRTGVSKRKQIQKYRPVKCVYIDGTPVTLRELRRIQKGLRSSNVD